MLLACKDCNPVIHTTEQLVQETQTVKKYEYEPEYINTSL